MSIQANRAAQVRTGVRIEIFTVIWMVVEAAVSIAAGILAGSALLVAFGLDSVIELVSGAILLWRLLVEARGEDAEQIEGAERRAAWVVSVALGAPVSLRAGYLHLRPAHAFPPRRVCDGNRHCSRRRPGDAVVGVHQTPDCRSS